MNAMNKKDRLVDSAAELFHHHGMNATSLADIAKHADIPIGNVYYYFKTKEELALAAVGKRKEQFTAAYAMIDDNIDDPRERLVKAISYFEKVRDEYTKYGCPIGRVIEDAPLEKDPVAKTAAQIFSDFVDWAEQQFQKLGHGDKSREYATSLMAGVQGATIMAKAFGNPSVMTDEIVRLTNWVESMPNKRISLGKFKSAEATTAA